MNSYLTNLIGRTQEKLSVLQPRPVSMYETTYAAERPVEETPDGFSTPVPSTSINRQTKTTVKPTADDSLNPANTDALAQPNQTEILQTLSPKSASGPLIHASSREKVESQPVNRSGETPAPLHPESPIPVMQSNNAASLFTKTNSQQTTTQTNGQVLTERSMPAPRVSVMLAAPELEVGNLASHDKQTAVLMPTTAPNLPVIAPSVKGQPIIKEPSLLLVAASPPRLATPIVHYKERKAGKSEQQMQNGRVLPPSPQSPIVPIVEPNYSEQPTLATKPVSIGPTDAMPTQTITVKIGRVEVRAAPPAKLPNGGNKQRPGDTLSLDDYLNRRQGGTS